MSATPRWPTLEEHSPDFLGRQLNNWPVDQAILYVIMWIQTATVVVTAGALQAKAGFITTHPEQQNRLSSLGNSRFYIQRRGPDFHPIGTPTEESGRSWIAPADQIDPDGMVGAGSGLNYSEREV